MSDEKRNRAYCERDETQKLPLHNAHARAGATCSKTDSMQNLPPSSAWWERVYG